MLVLVMKNKIHISINFLKRFFEPMFLDKISALKIVVQGFTASLMVTVIPVLFVPKITNLLYQQNLIAAKQYSMWGLILFLLVFFFRNFFTYYWYWAMNIPFTAALHKKYLRRILLIQPSVFEKNGIGYHLAKYNSGVSSLANNTRGFLDNSIQIIVSLSVALYAITSIEYWFGLLAVLVIFLVVLIIVYLYKKETAMIYPTIEIWNPVSGHVATAIVSKQEVLQSDKISSEVDRILEKINNIYGIEKSTYKYSIRRFSYIWYLPNFIILLLFFIYAGGSNTFDPKDIALMIVLTSTFSTINREVFSLFSGMFENYKNILAFWEMVDEPKIVGYEEGEKFEHRGGEIELRNISFSYEK